jgi:ankyrin repeat protein
MAAAASSEGARARPAFTFEDTYRMLGAKCSLEAFQERMLSSEFDVARDGLSVYLATRHPEHRPIHAWLRSADFAARVGAIELRNPLGVFFDACKEGDEEYVSRLSEEHPEWLDKGCEHRGVPVLHAMCQGGLMRFVPDLVSRFGDVDLRDWNGKTPLYWACQGGHLAVFEYLVSVGADVRAVSLQGVTMLHAACRGGNLAIVRALLDMRLDVNAHNALRETPLYSACRAGHVETVRCLLEHDAVLEPPGYVSPLCEALAFGRMGVAEYLVSVGAGLENVQGNSARVLDGVLRHDSVSAMEWLLKRGVVSVSKELIDRCLVEGRGDRIVLRYVLLHEESAPFVSGVDVSLLPDGFLCGYASLSKWREHELRMDLRYLMLSWRRGFVVSRLEG